MHELVDGLDGLGSFFRVLKELPQLLRFAKIQLAKFNTNSTMERPDRTVLGLDLVDRFALAATVLHRVMPADTGRFLHRREQLDICNHPDLLWACIVEPLTCGFESTFFSDGKLCLSRLKFADVWIPFAAAASSKRMRLPTLMHHTNPSQWILVILVIAVTLTAGSSANEPSAYTPGWEIQRLLDAAIARGDEEFALPQGDIIFGLDTLHVNRAHNMRIIGPGVDQTTLWFSPSAGIRVMNSSNLLMQGFSVDYNPLPYRQFTIKSITDCDWGSHMCTYELETPDRSLDLNATCAATDTSCTHLGLAVVYAPNRTCIAGSDFGTWPGHDASMNQVPIPTASEVLHWNGSTITARFGMLPPPTGETMRVGNVIIGASREYFTYTIGNSSGIVTQDVRFYSAPGMLIIELDGGGGHSYRRVSVVCRPGYFLASNADIFQSIDLEKGPMIEDSYFDAGNQDDFFNIRTTVHLLWRPNETVSKKLDLVGKDEAFLIMPVVAVVSNPLSHSSPDWWYGTSKPVSNLRPGDTVSCYQAAVGAPAPPRGLHQVLQTWPVQDFREDVEAALVDALDRAYPSGRAIPVAYQIYRVSIRGPDDCDDCDLTV